jgi:regulator of protease activity HflC (stomatin/prohibitin superfamily)
MQMTFNLESIITAPLVVIFGLLLISAIRIFREYERGVVFTLGRFSMVKGPGLVIIIPLIQQVVRVDLRTVVLEVPTQDVISRDNVSVKVSAVVYFRVVDPEKAIIQVMDFLNATSQLAQTMLRSVLGKHLLDDMLAERERLNLDIQQALDAQTDTWGIKVSNVEIKQVDLTESMIRAIARPKRNASAAPRSFTPKGNCRLPKNCSRRPASWRRNRRQSCCVTWRPLR